MAISKRTRFEVLRRDSHACRYCGASAPDVKITVDHVTPVALGGTDEPSNLVAACSECNAGKASTSPDEQLVASVSDDAHRWAQLQRAAWRSKVQMMGEIDDDTEEAIEELGAYFPNGFWDDEVETVRSWIEHGVPVGMITYAARRATNRGYGSRRRQDQWKYACGIIWSHIRSVEADVQSRFNIDGCWYSESDLTDVRCDAYDHGRRAGYESGMRDEFQRGGSYAAFLAAVTDGNPDLIAAYNSLHHLKGL